MTTASAPINKTIPSYVEGLRCRECGTAYDKAPIHVCEICFGPLEVAYDYARIGKVLTRAAIESRPASMWRYAELLPLDGPPAVGQQSGMTPLVRADRLAKRLGLKEVWVKNDAVSYPTLSFKDRVVSVAVSKAIEFGIGTIACASTGNLANATAAQAAAAGLPAVVLVPYDLEPAKILGTSIYGARVVGVKGTYDDVNRLCSEIAGKYGWGFVNVNLRPFYAEGSKSYAYEIAEQLGWRLPAHVVVPMAGGSLVTKVGKAFGEFEKLGLVPAPAPQDAHPRRPGGRVRADHRHGAGEPRSRAAGEDADQHRQVAGHRQPGRRLLRAPDDHRLGRLGGQAERRRDRRRHAPARRDRGDLHRDRRRRDAGRGASS